MTLLITVAAAIITTLVWYFREDRKELNLSLLALAFWGASLMWLIDAVFEYAELKDAYFQPAAADMLNDAFLGVCVVALGVTVWLIVTLIKDPKGVIRHKK